MKKFQYIMVTLLMVVLVLGATACQQEIAANSVFSADDLFGKKIAVQLGTTGDSYATSEYTNEEKNEGDETWVETPATMERFKTGNDAILALKQGKADSVIIDAEPAKAFVAVNDDLMILDEPFALEDYAICFAKGSAIRDEFNTALAALKAQGTFDQIIKNFIGDTTKGTCPYVSPENVDRSKGELVMGTNAYFPPYEFYEGKAIVGIDASVALAICDYLGYSLKIEDMDFDSIVAAVQNGNVDFGMAGMTVTEDRKQSVDFSDSYTTSTQVIVVRKK